MPRSDIGALQRVETAPKISATAARLSLAASAAALIALFMLHIVSPEFDPSWRVVSEYALGRYPWVLALMFLHWAVSSWTLAYAIRAEARTVAGKIGLVLLVLTGVGESMAAVFDLRQLLLHNIAAALSIPELPVAALLLSWTLARAFAWSSARKILLRAASLPWIGFLLMAVAMISLSRKTGHPILRIGWPNRLLIVLYLLWAITTAWQAIRVSRITMRVSL